MTDLQQQIEAMLRQAVADAFGDAYADIDPLVGPANNPKFGDFQANLAMALGKQLGQKPHDVAEAIVAKLDDADALLEGVPSIAGPGFINLKINAKTLSAIANHRVADPARLGIAPASTPQTVVVDYSAPNVAKEMHVGHLRSTVIGDAIARVLAFQGHKVIRQNHLGDWGTQFGMLIENLLERGSADAGQGDLTTLYKEAKVRFDAEPDFAQRAKQRVVKLQGGDEESLAVWGRLVGQSAEYFNAVYTRMGILLTPEDLCGESFFNPRLAKTVELLEAAGVLQESNGAKVVFNAGFKDREGEPLPMIVQKSDDGFLYATTDLAAARYRMIDLGADRVVYVVGAPQRQHFEMLFATLRQAGWVPKNTSLEYVPFGSVLGEDRKMFKTRSGETIRLVDLLEEAEQRATAVVQSKNENLTEDEAKQIGHVVGIGALKYADLSSDRIKDYVFSWERMLALEGNTAPYLINAYVRIASIFRKAEMEMDAFTGTIVVEDPDERMLVLKLMQFGAVVESVSKSLEPHPLCNYVYDLAKSFHKFYEHCPVLRSDVAPEIRESRLSLCKLAALTLRQGLGLLGIEVVDRM